MSRMTTLVAALLSIGLLSSCAGTAPAIEVPPDELVAPAKPMLPPPGATNQQQAAYLLKSEEWMDAAVERIKTLAGIICAITGQTCPQEGGSDV
ncbi:hypothetical protein NBRC116590_02590 [Pelagimonas sp. KU-00592-HH]|uniref:hypothetical protein n=1 Tax=Pelagimonas sp. KU-00592-HH TaxID=3127651 RepID=UPI003108DA76